jgi:hypothetical protein
MNAYLLTGEDRFLEPWRKQINVINAQAKTKDGKTMYPRMFGDDGWYSYSTAKYTIGVEEIAFLTQKEEDLSQVSRTGWWGYLAGKNDAWPEQSLRSDLATVRKQVLASRADTTTPDTRLADDPMKLNPASIASLVQQTLGGLPTNKQGLVLHSRLRHFDPINRRAGLPSGCAALVQKLETDSTTLTLVNTDQLNAKTVTIQAGGYGEHQFTSGRIGTTSRKPKSDSESDHDDRSSFEIDSRTLTLTLQPGCGIDLVLETRRYVNQPTLAFPWDRVK